MTKLEVTQEGEIFIYNFTLADGTKKQQKYSKTTHEAIKEYFSKPKKEKKKPAPAPRVEDVREYFKSKGYTLESANKFFEYYSTMEWKGANGSPVLNWKGKALSVWFVDKNKIQEKVEQTSSFFRS
jgi:hypothetical protein